MAIWRGKQAQQDRAEGKLWLRWLAALSGGLIVVVGAGLFTLSRVTAFDGPQQFWQQKGKLVGVDVVEDTAADDSLYLAYDLTFESDAGLRVRGYMRAPRQPGRWPVVILLGGVRTGKLSAQLITPETPYVILGLDYPWDGPTKLTAIQFLWNLLPARRAMILTPSAVFLAIDYLETRDDVDPSSITLAGASFGAQLAIVAGALDERAGPVVVCYGGGDWTLILDGNMKLEPAWLRFGLARIGARLLAPIEPLDYVADIAPDPVILINGLDDNRIPSESVRLLYDAARHPKRMIWLPEGHISSRDQALLGRVLQAAVTALADLSTDG